MLPDKNALRFFKDGEEEINFSDIITQDPYMLQEVFPLMEAYSNTMNPILITGETGTGKDLIAKKIHDLSPRRDKPFVAVNLASISSSLFESELFGYKKGTFTGAQDNRQGYFETAGGGTIFLDEIGELSKEFQGKLLRVIQYGEMCRVGDPVPRNLDIRIIAATNIDLKNQIALKNFREDLYYRLNKEHIELHPLRERGNDVILLTNKFLQLANVEYNKNCIIAESARFLLTIYKFPGNVRELENMVFNAVLRSKENEIQTFFPRNESYSNNFNSFFIEEKIKNTIETDMYEGASLKQLTENYILYVWKKCDRNTMEAGKILKLNERTLQRRLRTARKNKNPNYPYYDT